MHELHSSKEILTMRHDRIDDYTNPTTEPAEVVADKKISLLYDLYILSARRGRERPKRKRNNYVKIHPNLKE
jgi:hypothetical protein